MSIPYLKKEHGMTRLYVQGKPFYARSGEIHNSSSSSLEYMEEQVWPALRQLHLNCVVAPIYWECVEPEEGVFDFTLIDGLVEQARREKVRLVLLWFGLWKNSASTYVPGWVKNDQKRFFQVRPASGQNLGYMGGKMRIISPLCQEAVQADAKAYAAVMKHIREIDEAESTVITMQVENEIGVLGSARDHSDYADQEFAREIPAAVAEHFGVSGSWTEAFGGDADEQFMAWHYGQAVETIASAGKREYPIPMYVNAWLEQYPWNPGSYPSGGPQFKMCEMWRLAAPAIDFFAPDIYVENYRDVCDEYAAKGNPLFIPEVRQSADAIPFYFYAVGRHNALCFAPFGIEDMAGTAKTLDAQLLAQLNITASAMQTDAAAGQALGAAYELVANMEELVQKAHEEGRIYGFLEYHDKGTTIKLPHFNVRVSYGMGGFGPFQPPKPAGEPVSGGFLIQLSDWEFVVVGTRIRVGLQAKEGSGMEVEIERKEEGRYINGVWKRGRILNEDEASSDATIGAMPEALYFRVFEYEA